MLIAGLTGQRGLVRNGTPIPPSALALGGLTFFGLGAVLVIRGYGFNYSDWKDRRRARKRRRVRSHTRRR